MMNPRFPDIRVGQTDLPTHDLIPKREGYGIDRSHLTRQWAMMEHRQRMEELATKSLEELTDQYQKAYGCKAETAMRIAKDIKGM